MKTPSSFAGSLCISFLYFIIGCVNLTRAQQNLIINPDFENGSTATGQNQVDHATGWSNAGSSPISQCSYPGSPDLFDVHSNTTSTDGVDYINVPDNKFGHLSERTGNARYVNVLASRGMTFCEDFEEEVRGSLTGMLPKGCYHFCIYLSSTQRYLDLLPAYPTGDDHNIVEVALTNATGSPEKIIFTSPSIESIGWAQYCVNFNLEAAESNIYTRIQIRMKYFSTDWSTRMEQSVFVDELSLYNVTPDFTQSNTNDCAGGTPDGSIEINLTNPGSGGPYLVEWYAPYTSQQVTSFPYTITGLLPNFYLVSVTDNAGCKTTKLNLIIQLESPRVRLSTVAACQGQCNGSITAYTLGTPSAPYSYAWYLNGVPYPGTSQTINNLCPGSYRVDVTNIQGCTSSFTANVLGNGTAAPIQSINPTSPSCYGLCDGAASVTNPQLSATYNWSPAPAGMVGQGTPNVSGLCSNIYRVTVTDTRGCTASNSITISQPNVLKVVVSQNVSCVAGSATVIANASGGTPNYAYLWSTGEHTRTISAPAGYYCVTVTDAHGCTASGCINLTPSPALAVTLSVVNDCNNPCNSTITAAVTGGPVTYKWYRLTSIFLIQLFGQTNSTLVACPGTYRVKVTGPGPSACTLYADATISASLVPVSITLASATPSCSGANTGAASIVANGGTPPYTYLWSNGQTAPTASGLAPGLHCVTVSDASSCTKSTCLNVLQGSPVTVTLTPTNGFCNERPGYGNGSIIANASGGDPLFGYTYQWNHGQTTSTINYLPTGTYCVTATDYYGCSGSACTTITNPACEDNDPCTWDICWQWTNTVHSCFNVPSPDCVPKTSNLTEQEKSEEKFNIYPNPFNNKTTVEFNLMKLDNITLYICDITGKEILRLLNNEVLDSGAHQYEISGLVENGTYLCVLKGENFVRTKRLVKID